MAAAAYLNVSGSAAAVSYTTGTFGAYWEEAERDSCFMPYDTRGGAIMNKVIAILSFVVVGYATSDVAWANRHVSASTDREGRSLILAGGDEFVGPVLRPEGLSQRGEQPSWSRFSLVHTDIHHLPGSEPRHPVPSRSFIAPDGVALMFSWPFASTPASQLRLRAAQKEPKLNLDAGETDYRPW